MASGRGSNFQAIVDAAERGRLNARVVGLVCDNPDAPVLGRAASHGIPTAVVTRDAFASRAGSRRLLSVR